MNNGVILPMSEAHLEDVLEICKLSFPIPWSLNSLEKELENKFARYVVIEKDGILLGFGGMWIILDEAHITNIAVHPEHRNKGLGHVIVNALLEICAKEKVTAMTLEVRKSNTTAQKLYMDYGFREEGIRKAYYEDNLEDAIIMWKHNI